MKASQTSYRTGDRPPAFQFYAKEWQSSTRTWKLHFKGAMIDLMAWSWDNGPLPKSPEERAILLGLTPVKFRQVWKIVGKKWQKTRDGYVNKKLEKYRADLDKFFAEQSQRGKKGAEKRWSRDPSAIAPPLLPPLPPPSSKHASGHWPDDSSATATATADQNLDQDHRAVSRAAHTENPKVLLKLAHGVLDDIQSGIVTDTEKDALKDRAARMGIGYDSQAVSTALDVAEAQRQRRRA